MTDRDHDRLIAWAAELRAVHGRLREALDVARDSLAEGSAPERARDLLIYCRGFCTALNGHHGSEDAVLFPAIAGRRPDLVPVLDRLRQDHGMIAYLVNAMENAMDRGETDPSLEGHLHGIGAVMESHFRYEESELLGVLDTLGLRGDTARMLGPL